MPDDYLQRVLKARVYDVAIESPLELAPGLSRRLGSRILLKREDLQPIFSFKLRGAYNRIAHLSAGAAARGVICASAGNHAQGVALAARKRAIPALIVMPLSTPAIKVQAVIDLGAEVVQQGDIFDAAYEHALTIARERHLVFVHPFDDPEVIAGQGTIGMEIVRQTGGEIDAIFVPVGGGGLIAGIAAYVKQVYPRVRMIGVEPEDAAAMYESLQAGSRVTLERVGMFATGSPCGAWGRSHSRWRVAMSMRSSWSIPMRSAQRSRTFSRPRARSRSRRARSPSPASSVTSSVPVSATDGRSPSTAAPT